VADLETLVAFVAAAAVFAYMPGPATLYTVAQTLARGRRAGFMASVGLHIGGLVHVAAAALGLSVVFKLVPEAYVAVKVIGAAYLMWLGVGMIRQALATGALPSLKMKTPRRAFLESVLVEILNPKTAIFFIAFLPQFADPAAAFPIWIQMLILGAVVNVMFTSADVLCVLFAGAAIDKLRRSGRIERIARAAGGSLLIGLGGKLALDRS
jgi:threonine/homoserine/homoserine lactone efflux protein